MKRKWTLATFIVCCVGWIWIFLHTQDNHQTTLCYMQWLFHFPCPTCGLTRAVVAFIHGDIILSLYEHPLGIFAAICMMLFPIWILMDWIRGTHSFETKTLALFNKLRDKKYWIPFASLFLCTWIWNIYKHLC